MGCNGGCGGGKPGQTIAHNVSAAKQSVAPGKSPSAPLLVGNENGSVRRVIATRTFDSFRVQHKFYVTGDGLQDLIDQGLLVDITGVNQAGRGFQVGPYTYDDRAKAERVSAAEGLPLIEVF